MSVPTVEYGLMDIGSVIAPRVLATGPVATVYAGQLAGVEVAVKVYADRFDRDTAARFDRERRALDSLRCPAILGVDEVVETADGRSGVRMELCSGSLADRLGALGPSDVLDAGAAIADALVAAHRVGIVHGAITPHNVLYRRSGAIVVGDFGPALRERFPRDPAYAVEYAAPETLRENLRTPAADLYGLGAVLYAMLTGAPPFPRRTGQATSERILQVLREPPTPIRDASRELSEVVMRLLAKDPADRPADAAEVAAVLHGLQVRPAAAADDFDFDDFAGSIPVPAAPPSTPMALSTTVAPSTAVAPSTLGAPPPAGRTLILTTGEPPTPGRRFKAQHGFLIGLGAVAIGLVTIAPMVLDDRPAPSQANPSSAVAGGSPQVSPAGSPRVVLAPPTDLGRQVRLTWSADGDLDFAVVVAGEQIDTMVLVAHRDRTLTVPVDPDRKYCFQVRGTDGRQIWTSDPLPIRGARCKL
ncbi:serine/threonine-protein kinase [Hamadaea sp. NPDC050747]|uniref:serine/threonine-protein kinase n=1 Tax=Hamadaea sp. NPDC050747 TaxID=3155789 RepID=UPI0033CB2DED